MQFEFEKDPRRIEAKSFEIIRQLVNLEPYGREQQQVVMRIVHSLGLPHLAEQIRFSNHACESGMQALARHNPILCDVEMVKQGITKRMISQPPLCFLNHPDTIAIAGTSGETRTMAALQQWRNHVDGSVVIIGNAPTALFRLLEMLAHKGEKPALIIGMPVGFVGAAESKLALWQCHEELGVECITLLGREGGSAVAAATCNALLRCIQGEYY